MGLFDQFPYTNFHNLNLDWIIGQIKSIKSAVTSTAEDAASASHSAEAAAASAGSAAGSAAYAGNAAALVQQVRDDLDTVNTEMTNFVQAHSGLYNETVLWSGTASATGDTITLSDDIRNYKYIDVQATYKGAVSASAFGTFSSNVVRFTPEMFTDDNAVLNIPYAYNDQLQICTVFMFWDSLDPTDYTKISLGYSRRVSINDHGDLDNAADPGTVIVKIVGVKNIADAEVIDARVGEDDTVYSTLKQRLDTEYSDLKSAISDIEEQIEEGGTGSGLTTDIKNALLQLADFVAYINEDGQQYYDDLYDALYPTIVITAIELNTNSLSFGSLNATQQLRATTTPRGGAVTWSSSNTSVATVNQNGLVTSVGYGNATITATAGALSASCSVTITQASVTSISATYTQSGVVYDNDSLDSLKSDLVVTANWSNGASSTVASADYTLSGTLEVGTSTVTVSYGGQSDTFSVTVTEAPVMPLYNWDFTQSLTDTVQQETATLGSNANRSEAGVNFTTTGSNGWCRLTTSAIDMRNKTVEIDVSADAMTGSTNHSRLFAIATNPPDTNAAACSLIWRYSTSIGWTMYTGSDWCGEYLNKTTYPVTYFAGKTVKWYMDSDGIVTISVATIGSDEFTVLKTFTAPVVETYRTGVPMMGSSKGNNMNGVTVSGVRIYNGQV